MNNVKRGQNQLTANLYQGPIKTDLYRTTLNTSLTKFRVASLWAFISAVFSVFCYFVDYNDGVALPIGEHRLFVIRTSPFEKCS